jgi:hypothetical protein
MGIFLQNGAQTRCSTHLKRTKMAMSVFLYSDLNAALQIAASLVWSGLAELLACFVLFKIYLFLPF